MGLGAVGVLVDVDAILEGRVYSWLFTNVARLGDGRASQVVIDRELWDNRNSISYTP